MLYKSSHNALVQQIVGLIFSLEQSLDQQDLSLSSIRIHDGSWVKTDQRRRQMDVSNNFFIQQTTAHQCFRDHWAIKHQKHSCYNHDCSATSESPKTPALTPVAFRLPIWLKRSHLIAVG